jgi:hypothetical protein
VNLTHPQVLTITPVVVAATPDSDNHAWRASSPQSANYAIEASRISFVKFFVCLIAGLPLLLFDFGGRGSSARRPTVSQSAATPIGSSRRKPAVWSRA